MYPYSKEGRDCVPTVSIQMIYGGIAVMQDKKI